MPVFDKLFMTHIYYEINFTKLYSFAIMFPFALAYHSLSINKEDTNPCRRDFIQYIKQSRKVIDKEIVTSLKDKILKQVQHNLKRDLAQICNLQLQTLEQVQQMFSNLLKSKTITKEQIQNFLEDIKSAK